MSPTGQICTRGLWDESVPGISFDAAGVSNFARIQESLIKQFPRGSQQFEEWLVLTQKMQLAGRGKRYHCVIGVSGGVEGAYLLHLAKQYGLRPLAVYLDNGFNSEIAVRNILTLTKRLKIDLETYVVNDEEIKDLNRAFMWASLPWIDGPRDLAMKGILYRVAKAKGINYILRDTDLRLEGKLPQEWTYTDGRQLASIHRQFGDGVRLRTFPKLSLLQQIRYGLLHQIQEVYPYNYLQYHKQSAQQLLQRMYDWKDTGGHYHENLFTKFAVGYWLPQKFGMDKRVFHLSAQVLSGVISREEGLEALAKPFASQAELASLKDYVLRKLEISDAEFAVIWQRRNKFPDDYSSNHRMIYWNLVGRMAPFGREIDSLRS